MSKSRDREASLTPFERDVLRAALAIPFGQTRSYQWIARRINRPLAVRAVGQALRKNPYPLMIPCHRVIRSDGRYGGYAGRMGAEKERLIRLEKHVADQLGLNE